MRKIISVVTICFLAVMMFSGCSVLQKLGFEKSGEDELQPASSIVMGEDEAKKLSDKLPMYLYFANEDNTKLKLEVRYISMAEAKKSTSSLASLIVKELINGPSKDSGLKATIPQGTKLKNSVSISSGVATVDLSKEFVSKHPGGKDAAKVTIYSIVNSLTELKEIEKVKFTIDGKSQQDFKGSFQFNTPFPRSAALISKETKTPGSTDKAGSKGTDSKKKSSPTASPKAKDGSVDTAAPVDDMDDSVNTSGDAGISDGLEDILE